MNNHGQFSIIPARAIYDTRLDSTDRDVLNCLGLYANRDGWCYPNQKSIGKILDKSRPFISSRIRHLSECGYVQIVEQHDPQSGARIANRYRILHDAELPKEFDRSLQGAAEEDDTLDLEDAEDKSGLDLDHTGMKLAERPKERLDYLSSLDERAPATTSGAPPPNKKPEEKKKQEPSGKDLFAMSSSIAKVCKLDIKLNKNKLFPAAKRLLLSGYQPCQVEEVYNPGGVYWFKDWRGKKKEPPTIAIINDSIKRLLGREKADAVWEIK